MSTVMSDNLAHKLDKIKRVYSFWGRFPRLYNIQDIFTFLGRAKIIRKRAVKEMDIKPEDTVLEVACGSGRNFSYLTEMINKNGLILGLDYSPEMLNAARQLCEQKSWKNLRLIQGDAAKCIICEKKIDGVISILGISAIPEWEKALKRCYDVLKPGSKLVVCDACLFTGILGIFNPIIKLIYSHLAAWDPDKNIPKEMKSLFKNIKVEYFNFGTFFIAVSVKEK